MQRTILIVDDVAANRLLLKELLKEQYRAEEAADGAEALSRLRAAKTPFSAVLLDLVMPEMDGFAVLEEMRRSAEWAGLPVIVTTGRTDESSEARALALGATDYVTKPYNATILKRRLQNAIELREASAEVNLLRRDRLTGLYTREVFFEKADELLQAREPGHYVMASFDVDNFRVINDQYGAGKGDRVLRHMAACFQRYLTAMGGVCCRMSADHFAALYPAAFMDADNMIACRREACAPPCIDHPLSIRTGRYVAVDLSLSAAAMYDRATLAEASVRRRYDAHIALYDESMRQRLLEEQAIVNEMYGALRSGQFEAWFQPQFNHSSGEMIGSEALARWRHPQKGLLPPSVFVPIFERNGFIYDMDKAIWAEVCRCLRSWLDQGLSPLPVSVNLSRQELTHDDLPDCLSSLVKCYELPAELLRLEITESAFTGETEQVLRQVEELKARGFLVELDDFGSGYSSLNTLKDVPADILKLDMRFLESGRNSQRGGNILESIVRMAKWLGMPVIAEGVETKEQADYLKSIGCFYVQGYLYAKPMPLAQFEPFMKASRQKTAPFKPAAPAADGAFWDPASLETKVFNQYIGPACVFEYRSPNLEMIRLNDAFAKALGGLDAEAASRLKLNQCMNESGVSALLQCVERAVRLKERQSCQVSLYAPAPNGPPVPLRVELTVISSTGSRHLLFATLATGPRAQEQSGVLPTVLRAVMASTSDLSFVKNTEYRYLCASQAFVRLVGREAESELLGKTDYELFDKPTADAYRRDDAALFKNKKPLVDILETIPSPDGSPRYSSTSKYLLRDETGNVIGLYGVGRDVTETHLAFEQLRLLTESIPGGIASYALRGGRLCCQYFNEGFCQFSGYNRETFESLTKDDPLALCHREDEPALREWLTALLQGKSREDEFVYRRRGEDGESRWIRVKAAVSVGPNHTRTLNTVQLDDTQRKKAEEQLRMSEEQCRLAVEQSGNILFRYSAADRSVALSPEAAAFLQMPQRLEDVPYGPLRMGVVASYSEEAFLNFFERILRGERMGAAEFEVQTAQGWRWMKARQSSVFSDDGTPMYAVISLEDVTLAHKREEERAAMLENERLLQRRAELDGLTGVYQKTVAEARIREKLEDKVGRPCTLIIADIDNLKTINDTLGHPQGDRAIQAVADVLRRQYRRTDVIGRAGGDEFIVYLEGPSGRGEVCKMLDALMERVKEIRIGDRDQCPVCLSLGAAMSQTRRLNFEELYARADSALYQAKRNGKNQFRFFAEGED